jgi:hypothetical protein
MTKLEIFEGIRVSAFSAESQLWNFVFVLSRSVRMAKLARGTARSKL